MNTAYNMDCMEYMRTQPDKAFDLAVVDPPYGGGYDLPLLPRRHSGYVPLLHVPLVRAADPGARWREGVLILTDQDCHLEESAGSSLNDSSNCFLFKLL